MIGKRPTQQRRQAPQQQQSAPSEPPIHLQRVFSTKRTAHRCDAGTNACHWFLPCIPSTTSTFAWRSLTTGIFSPLFFSMSKSYALLFLHPPQAISQTKSVCIIEHQHVWSYSYLYYLHQCKSIGRGHRVSPTGLPIEQVVGEYSLS